MHLEYWGLTEAPFSSKLSANHYFPSATHEEAIARLSFLVEQNRRLGVISGISGSGKSLIFDVLAKQLRRHGCYVCKLNLMGLDSDEFLWRLASGLGHYMPGETRSLVFWRAIQDRLAAYRYQRITTVFLWDDADECEIETLTDLSRIVQMEQFPDSRITIVLSCRNQRMQLLGPRLSDLSELSVELEPWSLDETEQYIVESIQRAGRTAESFRMMALKRSTN